MKLLVFDAIYIPGYGMGPFITPIEINDPRLLAEVRLKSRVKVIEDRKTSKKKNNNNVYPISLESSVKEEVKEETIVPEEKEEVVEEVVAPEAVEEIVEEQPVEVEEVTEEIPVEVVEEAKKLLTEEDLKDKTVAELKEILDGMGISYLYKDGKNILIKKIIENQ